MNISLTMIRRRIEALESRPAGQTLTITGGLPDGFDPTKYSSRLTDLRP
jgi:hypothetical protein